MIASCASRGTLVMQEQRFELLLKPHRALGLNGSSQRQAQAFAFGTGGLWCVPPSNLLIFSSLV